MIVPSLPTVCGFAMQKSNNTKTLWYPLCSNNSTFLCIMFTGKLWAQTDCMRYLFSAGIQYSIQDKMGNKEKLRNHSYPTKSPDIVTQILMYMLLYTPQTPIIPCYAVKFKGHAKDLWCNPHGMFSLFSHYQAKCCGHQRCTRLL